MTSGKPTKSKSYSRSVLSGPGLRIIRDTSANLADTAVAKLEPGTNLLRLA